MAGKAIKVVEDNEHLGQVVSGERQEAKNIDERIKKGRGHLFNMLGTAFAYKCLLSPLVKIHLFRTYTCPIVRSGLSSFALRAPQMAPLSVFHRKVLKSFLHLSQSAPTPAIHFLLGELPMEGKIHRDMFSLFYGVWINPDTKIYKIIKYLLATSSEHSRTWVINLRHICRMYQLEDPLVYLQNDPLLKSQFKELVMTKITAFHENELRKKAQGNDLMQYLNVNLCGLRGRHHPCLSNVITVDEVKKMRPHLKLLTGDYLTYKRKFDETGKGNPICRLCRTESESICHIVAICPAYNITRNKIIEEMSELCLVARSELNFQEILNNPNTLTQFILDPTSFNLKLRVNISDPIVTPLFNLSRDLCNCIHSERMKRLNSMKKN